MAPLPMRLPVEMLRMVTDHLEMPDMGNLVVALNNHPVVVEALYEREMRDALHPDFHLRKGANRLEKMLHRLRNGDPALADTKLPALYWGIKHNILGTVRAAATVYLKRPDISYELLTGGYRKSRFIPEMDLDLKHKVSTDKVWETTLPNISRYAAYSGLSVMLFSPSPLQLAVASGNFDLVEAIVETYLQASPDNLELLKMGSRVTYNAWADVEFDPLGIAAHFGDARISEYLIKKGIYGEEMEAAIATRILPIFFARQGIAQKRMEDRAQVLQQLLDHKILTPSDTAFSSVFNGSQDPILKVTALQQATLDVTHVALSKVLIRAGAPWAPWTEDETMPFSKDKPPPDRPVQYVVRLKPANLVKLSPLEIVLLHRYRGNDYLSNQWELFHCMMEEGIESLSDKQGQSLDKIQARCKKAIRLVVKHLVPARYRKPFLDRDTWERVTMVVKMVTYLVEKGKLDAKKEDLSGAIFQHFEQGGVLMIAGENVRGIDQD
ncbi:hypothetical protein QBC40DRAFT_267308 [Triangularia verruculosa]|uniref:Uncharacterized protein n=1 Tax=Triangularia verruculosa TaxID=2587418 RepID=A0AAN6XCX8_9PEZI|nr:hypothetical protein QBC40DRAFT_267308 [Triangularia verruculosa]